MKIRQRKNHRSYVVAFYVSNYNLKLWRRYQHKTKRELYVINHRPGKKRPTLTTLQEMFDCVGYPWLNYYQNFMAEHMGSSHSCAANLQQQNTIPKPWLGIDYEPIFTQKIVDALRVDPSLVREGDIDVDARARYLKEHLAYPNTPTFVFDSLLELDKKEDGNA